MDTGIGYDKTRIHGHAKIGKTTDTMRRGYEN